MSALRKSARGRDCTFRAEGVCNHDPATTVLAHLPSFAMGAKANDLFGFFACSACHALYDRVDPRWQAIGRAELDAIALRAMRETQEIWLAEGLISIKGGKP